jgi:hypothetical protein
MDQKFKQADPEKLKAAEKTLALDYTEMVNFQELKSLAQLKGILDLETAQFIYNAIGDWEHQTVGTKFILTKLHADLIQKHMTGAF